MDLEEIAVNNLARKLQNEPESSVKPSYFNNTSQFCIADMQIPKSHKDWSKLMNIVLAQESIESQQLYMTLRARRLRSRDINGAARLYLRPILSPKLYEINDKMVQKLHEIEEVEYELVALGDKTEAPFKERLFRKNLLDVALNNLSAEYYKLEQEYNAAWHEEERERAIQRQLSKK